MKQEEISKLANWIRNERDVTTSNKVLVIIGSTGSGKTTLALAIGGLLEKKIVPVGVGYHYSRFDKAAGKTIIFDGFPNGIPKGMEDEVMSVVSQGTRHIGLDLIDFKNTSVIATAPTFKCREDLDRRSVIVVLDDLEVSERVSERVAMHNNQLAVKSAL